MEKIRGLIKGSPFLRYNLVFFFGSFCVAVLNYLFYPVLGRIMEPADFGEVQALISIFTQATIFLMVLSLVSIHATVNISDQKELNRTLMGLERIAYVAGGIILCIALVSTPWLKDFFHFEHIWPFVALIVGLGVSIPASLRMAYLRGKKQFAKSSLSEGIGSLAKLMFAVVFVLLGLKAFGAIAGVVMAQIIALGFALNWSKKAGLRSSPFSGARAKLTSLKPELKYALAVAVASGVTMALFTLDILAVKHYFPPEIAGLYAGMSTISRIIFFVTGPVTGVLITLVNMKQEESKNRMQLLGSIGLIAAIGGALLVFFTIFPDTSIKFLVGEKYLFFVDLLPKLCLVMLILALSHCLIMYNISLKRYRIIIAPLIALLLTITLVANNHAAVSEIIYGLLVGSTGLLVLVVPLSLLLHNKRG